MQIKSLQDSFVVKSKFDEVQTEKTVENDVILPDYLPDIERVIRVDAQGKIRDCTMNGDKANVEGSIVFNVCYVPQGEKTLRSYLYEVSVSEVIAMKPCEMPLVQGQMKLSYINCRVQNPRKISLRADLLLTMSTYMDKYATVMNEVDESRSDIELLRHTVKLSEPVSMMNRTFKLFEDLEISQNHRPIGEILRSENCATLSEMKLIANKIVIKGEMKTKLLYSAFDDNTQLETASYIIPFSQVLDMSGIDDDCKCAMSLDVQDVLFRVMEDPAGENRIISVEAAIKVNAQGYKDREVTYISDAFSTKNALNATSNKQKFENVITDVFYENAMKEIVRPISGGINGVIDVISQVTTKQNICQDGKVLMTGSVDVGLIIYNENDEIENIDRSIPFKIEFDGNYDSFDGAVRVDNITYAPSDEGVELKIALIATGSGITENTANVINKLELDETIAQEKPKSTLVIYYPEKGEKIWDIAKKYNSSLVSILTANNKIGDIIDNEKILIVPVK